VNLLSWFTMPKNWRNLVLWLGASPL